MSNVVKLYETGPWGPLEEDWAKEMIELGYNPHDRNDIDEFFMDLEGEADGPVEMLTQIFGKTVMVSVDLFYAENENEKEE